MTIIRGSSDRSLYILTSLASGPKHGYALMQDIEEFAGVRLGAGSLYGCLAKLEAQRLIEPLPSDDRRRPYRITTRGALALKEQLEKSRQLAVVGLRRIAQAYP